MSIFQGLYLYEIVMLVLGVVLFFVALYRVMRGDEVKKVALLFMFAIVMIGYPSIQSIQYKDGVITIQKATEQIQENPTSKTARRLLQTKIEQLAPRILGNSNNVNSIALVASAQYALGQDPEAKATLTQASSINPNAKSVLALQNRIATFDSLASQTAAAQANPNDASATADLKKSLAKASSYKISNPNALLAVAHAQAVLGQREQASQTTAKVLAINPQLPEAMALQHSLSSVH